MLSSATGWWRKHYSKLPPAVQMIGLQLWMPLFFITAFCLCYVVAFHAPKVHDVPVAVVNTPAASVVTQKIEAGAPDTFAFSYFADRSAAVESVRDGDNAAALVISADGQGQPELFVAGAHQFQASSIVKTSFQQIFATGEGVKITDIAPLPKSDSFGQGAMYMMMSWCIAGYMVAMFIGMMGAPLGHWTRVSILAGGAIVLAVVSNVIVGPIVGVYPAEHFLQMTGLAMLWIFAIGLFVNGISYFFGRFITGPALLMFVFVSIPASGAAFPAWMVPSFFKHLQPFVVGHGITEMIKRILYGVGEPYWQGFLLMGAYAVLDVLTMLVGKRWRESKEVDRILSGQSTMMIAAQRAMMAHGMENRATVLRRHGIDPETGKPLHQATGTASADTDDAEAYTELELTAGGDPLVNGGRSLGLGEIDREHDILQADRTGQE